MIGAALPPRDRGRADAVSLVLLLVAVVTGFVAQQRLASIDRDFDGYWTRREAAVAEVLDRELADLLEAGEAAATVLAETADLPEPDRHPSIVDVRMRYGLTAAALYDSDGRLVVWDGTHQGTVPDPVRAGSVPYAYAGRPLFSHLYFTEPLPDGRGTAMVAALLSSDLPLELGAETGDFASRIRSRTGEELRLSRAELAAGEGIWDLRLGEETLFSVAVARPAEAARLEQVRDRWAGAVGVLALAGWVMLAIAGRGASGHVAAVATALAGLGLLLPFGSVLGSQELFAPGAFVLPGPFDLPLGRLLVVALAGALGAGLVAGSLRAPFPAWVGGAAVAVLFPAVTALVRAGASPGFLAGGDGDLVGFQLVLATLLALAAGGTLRLGRASVSHRRAGITVMVALGLAGLLSGAAAAGAYARVSVPLGALSLWGVPAYLAAVVLGRWEGWRRDVLGWTVAVVLGTTAALPVAWAGRIESRMTVAERQLERLGGRVDPFLQFLLGRFGEVADSVHARGAAPAEVLYRAWVESGLAEDAYPVWLTFWSGDSLPEEELRIGVGTVRPTVADEFLAEARLGDSVLVRRFDVADAHYLALVPLPGGALVSAVVPPLRGVRFASPLGPLFSPTGTTEPDPLTLVPVRPGDPVTLSDRVSWVRSPRGWHGEVGLTYPDALFQAHYRLDLSSPLLLFARSTLLLTANATLFGLLWMLGRILRHARRPAWTEWRGLFVSFRARVTLALFAFFLLSNAILGTLAYRALTDAAERTAQVLAERVALDAAGFYQEARGEMDLLARRAGADLLEFEGGALKAASVEELVQLGLYEGWVPYTVYETLYTREQVMATLTGTLGRWEYITAYHNLPDGGILAAPVPLEAGATAVRRRDLAHLLAFAVLAGAALSLALALLVGRALARPIELLRVASERVGGGNLGVRLSADRHDEFGSVFESFNRMVSRLRRARRALVRTTRRSQAIAEESASGVVAFGPEGDVTLVNQRAQAFLGRPLVVGETFEETGGPADEVVAWVRLYFRDALGEVGAEFQLGDRRIRVRARRISRQGAAGGAVMSLEDVTDELRAERVLAWGEMARQVAHEVKNPLTPIKLSIQHVRRAWEDRRPDFGDILTRNAGAMLAEIDRLAAIASSFARLGTPGAADAGELEPVEVDRLVEDVLTLYDSGADAIRFERELSTDLPAAIAREPEVREVLVNLLENARAAIRDSGTVRVESGRKGAGLVLRVRDDGSGIPAELVSRVFEPHFSTRSTGAGLGLAIVRRLVESWGGAVTIESTPGQGTTVSVLLRPWPEGGGESHPVSYLDNPVVGPPGA